MPRVWTRFLDKINATVRESSDFRQNIFKKAVKSKIKLLNAGKITDATLYDEIVLKKAQSILGGRVKIAACGGAPISPDIISELRAIFGFPIIEGYGSTECGAACALTMNGNWENGLAPIISNEIKLVSVPELNYLSENDQGEVCIRGGNVMQGYYENPLETEKAIDSDGWLHTGDIGRWNNNGSLTIFDRKKNIFKLQQGEYIAPEKIENVLSQLEEINQIFIYGDSLKSALVAIVVLDMEWAWKKSEAFSGFENFDDLIASKKIENYLIGNFNKLGKAKGLYGFELPKAVFVAKEVFSVENDLTTPTMKLKRPQLKKMYQKNIDLMYAELE